YEAVVALFGRGLSDYQMAARTGVGRGTVRNWRIAGTPPSTILRAELAESWMVSDAPTYCYLLGAYLGDGTVCVTKGIRLQIVNDQCYPGVTKEILDAMAITFPYRPPRSYPSSTGDSDVLCISHPAILRAFPQH